MAKKRLCSLKNRLMRDSDLHKRYVEVIQGYIKAGYAKRISYAEIDTSNTVWYLPHFPVMNQHKPGKVRVVFDAAAKYGNVSLNDCLMSGPDLVSSLLGVILRFRRGRVALVADVEAMFHQVRVAPQDTDALRFLWWDDGDISKEPVPHRVLVHIFGAASSPSCAAFCLKQTAVKFGNEHKPRISEIVNEDFYVDDCLTTAESVDKGIEIVKELTQLMSKGGFNLTKWLTNNDELLSMISEEKRAKCVQNHVIEGNVKERVLGIQWNVANDEFGFKVNIADKPNTRRGILSIVASVFDPLGIAAPITLLAKFLLQELCKQNLGWDQEIADDDAVKWRNWLHQLQSSEQVKIQRCYRPFNFGKIVSYELHHFADGSELAYGAVSYLRIIDKNGQIHVAFLVGKARLAPCSRVTIPRLELTAAVLAVKSNLVLRKELKMNECSSTFWTDSTVVLQCIRNSKKRFSTFVANRLAKIDKNTDESQWRHVPTKMNPADDASRGLRVDAYLKSGRWINGPEFLRLSEDKWPKMPDCFPDPSSEFCPKPVPETKSAFKSIDKLTELPARLTVQELSYAERDIIEYVQRQSFREELKCILNGKFISKGDCSRRMLKLNPVLEDGLMKVGGRLENAPIMHSSKHPIILPHISHLTDLVIRDHHNKVGHSGMGHTWTSLREKYRIIKGGVAVRRFIGNCVSCLKRNARPGKQFMADLPSCRLKSDEPVFSHVGVDLFGHFLVRQGRSDVKRWGCVFSCMTTRAVHIEVVNSLSADSFIFALRRFIARRGQCTHIYSDNAGNFVLAEKIFENSLKMWNDSQVHGYLRQKGITWHKSPPTGSNHGGAWERMIRSIRRIFNAVTQGQTMTDEVFRTALIECESCLNSRPIIPVTFDPRDEEPLTPNHLLLLRSNQNMPPGVFDKNDCYVKRRWAQSQYLANELWRTWIREYLPTIIERHKWFQKERNFKKEDVVLVVDDSQPRSRWAMGRIVDVYPDKKGLIRTVLVKIRNSLVKRPITKLVLVVEGTK
ncbi:uncharacterized protein LOC144432057 [Styela clava]